LQPKLQITSFR